MLQLLSKNLFICLQIIHNFGLVSSYTNIEIFFSYWISMNSCFFEFCRKHLDLAERYYFYYLKMLAFMKCALWKVSIIPKYVIKKSSLFTILDEMLTLLTLKVWKLHLDDLKEIVFLDSLAPIILLPPSPQSQSKRLLPGSATRWLSTFY